MCEQGANYISRESTIFSHLVKRIPRAWSNLALQRMWAKSYARFDLPSPGILRTRC